jgi:hypothetical protein
LEGFGHIDQTGLSAVAKLDVSRDRSFFRSWFLGWR